MKIPKYLKEKRVWKYRVLFILVPTILAYIVGLWEFSIAWLGIIIFLLLCFDTYSIVKKSTQTFK